MWFVKFISDHHDRNNYFKVKSVLTCSLADAVIIVTVKWKFKCVDITSRVQTRNIVPCCLDIS